MQRRERGTTQSLGASLGKSVRESRVLLVGAGGIGCEVLKNLVTSGYGTNFPSPGASNGDAAERNSDRKPGIVVIDLDTIDLSNLNRQFLFRKQHIKKPKALVAKETVSKFNPTANIDAHHGSIFDTQYNVEFFEGFDVVFNALDNVSARRHVNKMCLAANVPLIESGTTGYNGQVQAIKKGITECYDCNEKPVQKSYPICTIRSTPSQPIHCIVWAKSYLLPEVFGVSEEDSSDVTVTGDDNAEEVAKLKEEAEALKKIRALINKPEFSQEIFNKVFHDDIERLKSMSEMWQSRKSPESLRFESLSIDPDTTKQGKALASLDQNTWGLLDNFKVFCYSIGALSDRVQAGEKSIEFDKEDKDTLDFVASAANLRAHIFGIPINTEWDIKQMAGNIIPAIATANALTASLCVMESFKIFRVQQTPQNGAATAAPRMLNGKFNTILGGSKMVYLNSKSTERMILGDRLVAPRPDCPVCSPTYAKISLPKDESPKVQQLVDLLKAELNLLEFSITTNVGIIYDPDLEDNLQKPLSDFGVTQSSNGFITVSDDSDEPKVDLILSVAGQSTEGSELGLLPAQIDLPLKSKKKADETNGHTNGDADPVSVDSAVLREKRKRSADDDGGIDNTKKKVKGGSDDTAQAV